MNTNNMLSNEKIKEMILAARGDLVPDLVLKNARIVNVFTNDIEPGDVAVKDGYIVGIGEYEGKEEIDIGGKVICPGLIDGHIHIESSMISPSESLCITGKDEAGSGGLLSLGGLEDYSIGKRPEFHIEFLLK